MQGKVAGINIAGEEAYFEGVVPVTTLEAFGISLFSMGVIDEEQASYIIKEEDIEKNIYKKIIIKEDRVIGGLFLNNPRAAVPLKEAIIKNVNLSTIDYKKCSLDNFIIKLKEVNTK
jgi:nitrite reductase (NADH) large subunit